ncbi:hypothetical protein GCM10027563_46600 [Parasphingorhabdus pacifica]
MESTGRRPVRQDDFTADPVLRVQEKSIPGCLRAATREANADRVERAGSARRCVGVLLRLTGSDQQKPFECVPFDARSKSVTDNDSGTAAYRLERRRGPVFDSWTREIVAAGDSRVHSGDVDKFTRLLA